MTTVTRRNRFNGESVELTAAEADKHDKIFYHEAMATLEDQNQGSGTWKKFGAKKLPCTILTYMRGPRTLWEFMAGMRQS